MPKTIHLDGATLEGGGQLLRIAVGLSALTQQPLRITDIRGNRSGGGGLKQQHLTCVQWLSRVCGAPTRGAEKKSRSLEFFAKDHDPTSLKLVKYGWNTMNTTIDIGSPGAVGLVFQAILPYVIFAGAMHTDEEIVYITIKGGTNVSNSPSIDYIEQVLCPMLHLIGLPAVEVSCRARGWSTGRMEVGAVTFGIRPLRLGESLRCFEIAERGELERIEAIVLGPRASEKAFNRELKSALTRIEMQDVPLSVSFELSGHEKRLYILLVAHMSTKLRFGRDHLFQERFSSLDYAVPRVVTRAVEDLKMELDHGGSVDEYLRDQLVVYQALAAGKSRVRAGTSESSLHTRTAQWVVGEILAVDGTEAEVEGIEWVPGQKWTRHKHQLDNLTADVNNLAVVDS